MRFKIDRIVFHEAGKVAQYTTGFSCKERRRENKRRDVFFLNSHLNQNPTSLERIRGSCSLGQNHDYRVGTYCDLRHLRQRKKHVVCGCHLLLHFLPRNCVHPMQCGPNWGDLQLWPCGPCSLYGVFPIFPLRQKSPHPSL